MISKKTIESYVGSKEKSFLALGIFLLLTITLASDTNFLSNVLGVLSAGISYFLFLEIISISKNDEVLPLSLMKTFIIFFALLFCVWVILNMLWPQGQFMIF
jgi:hypothetical protein